MNERLAATGADCGAEKPPRPHVATYQEIHPWDAGRRRFATRSGQLDWPAEQDAKRF